MKEILTKDEYEIFKTTHSMRGQLKDISNIGTGYIIEYISGEKFKLPKQAFKWVESVLTELHTSSDEYSDNLIYGKDKTRNIVSIEVKDGEVYIYTEGNSEIKLEKRPFQYWILSNVKPNGVFTKLYGDLHYSYMKEFEEEKDYKKALADLWKIQADKYVCYDQREAYMVKSGVTYFKGMRVNDISILSFDIETNKTLDPKLPNAKVLMISNTFRSGNRIERKLFSLDEYKNELSMIQSWCQWVTTMNPSILVGHNIFTFDLPYLQERFLITQKTQIGINGFKTKRKGLTLGRDGSDMDISSSISEYRYDGSQTYSYHKISIFGREIVDTFFLTMKYDVSRNFTNYKLKVIIQEMGFEKENRIKWDFEKDNPAKIWDVVSSSSKDLSPHEFQKWEDYKTYCIDDSDDSLKIFDEIIPSYFFTNVSIPRPFQNFLLSATGSWINMFLIRGYLTDFHSIPKPSPQEKVHGGISFGIPGVYKNLAKVDVKSEYPSAILEYGIYPEKKDVKKYFLKMVEHFTLARFSQVKKYRETGDKYYNDLQAASKIFINSAFGMLGTNGLHFNDFKAANYVTGIGRQVIRKSLLWASGKDVGDFMEKYDYSKDKLYDGKLASNLQAKYDFIIGPCDTDSISFCKKDMSEFTQEELGGLLKEMNDFLPEKILMEDDGIYKSVVIIAAKNYILDDGRKIKFKGSSITDSKKEKALLELIEKVGLQLLSGIDYAILKKIYLEYCYEALHVKDITRWAVKKTVTKAVLDSLTNDNSRTNELKVLNAIKHLNVREGDKVYVYDAIDGMVQEKKKGEMIFDKSGKPKMINNKILKTIDQYDNDVIPEKLLKRVYATMSIFSEVIDINQFINFSLTTNRKYWENISRKELKF